MTGEFWECLFGCLGMMTVGGVLFCSGCVILLVELLSRVSVGGILPTVVLFVRGGRGGVGRKLPIEMAADKP